MNTKLYLALALLAIDVPTAHGGYLTSNFNEHSDLQIRFDGTALSAGWGFEERAPEAAFEANEVLNVIRAPFGRAIVPLGSGSTYAFTGVAPGGTFYKTVQSRLDPTVSGPNLPLLGITAGEDEGGDPLSPFQRLASVGLQLTTIRGPGQFSLYANEDSGPVVFFSTVTGANALPIEIFGHSDFNFAFSAPGHYDIDVTPVGQFNAANGGGSLAGGVYTVSFDVDQTAPAPPSVILALFGLIGTGLVRCRRAH